MAVGARLGGNARQIAGMPYTNQAMKPDLNVLTPEERHMMSERRRVESMITAYNNKPSRYDDAYVMQLEQYAAQYGIPFQRASAGVIRNAGAAVGGFIDSFMWDLLPDSWYSSDATATARKAGKGVGLAGAALLTGGTSLLGKGMTKFAQSGVGQFTTAGAALGAKKMLAPTIAGVAQQGGMAGNLARGAMSSGQGQNIATMAVDDIAANAAKLAKSGNKKGAMEAIERGGALIDDAAKVKMAENTGAVTSVLERDIYAAAKGLGKGATSAVQKAQNKTEILLESILKKEKGVGPKSKKAINTVLKDKNKVDQLEKILNDPSTSIDDAVVAIKNILPKSQQTKLVKKSELVKLLTNFYGYSTVGG
jgi:hypothetical protein